VQLGRVGFGQEHTLSSIGGDFFDGGLGVVGARQDFREHLADFRRRWARRGRLTGYSGSGIRRCAFRGLSIVVTVFAGVDGTAIRATAATPAISAATRGWRSLTLSGGCGGLSGLQAGSLVSNAGRYRL